MPAVSSPEAVARTAASLPHQFDRAAALSDYISDFCIP